MNLVNNQIRHINQARKDKANIVFVEYITYGETDFALLKAAHDFEIVYKDTRDGSKQIIACCKDNGLNKFRVAGIYLEQCVKATVLGLNDGSREIEVIENSVYSAGDFDTAIYYFDYLAKNDSNVKLV
jgi:nicotinamidase-related amidase